MIRNCSCCSHTQGIWVSNRFKLHAVLHVDRLDRKVVVIKWFKKMLPLEVKCLESHLLILNDWVTFVFHAKVPWWFVWEDWTEVKLLCFFINNQMMNSFSIARTISEFNRVVDALLKEGSEILSYSDRLDLIMMRQWDEYVSYWMDSISNDYDI